MIKNIDIVFDEVDENVVSEFSRELQLPKSISTLLYKKGLFDKSDIKQFFFPENLEFNDPFLFNDMGIATDRILTALEKNEKICIYGDYDVDGISSTAVMVRGLKKIGISPSYYIPNRFNEGYGINKKAFDMIKNDFGASLVITVDCGITSVEEIDYAKEIGLDVIITDHHNINSDGLLPDCVAIINPKVPGENYPCKDLAGVAVAWKFLIAIYEKKNVSYEKDYLLEFVALGTASDIVPLVKENRTIAKIGFRKILENNYPAFEFLLKNGNVFTKDLTTSDIVFKIAPYLNASGRMKDAETSIELLLEDDREIAQDLIERLKEFNNQRKKISDNIFKEAEKMVEKKEGKRKGYLLYKNNWHEGVLGIVASRMVNEFNAPFIILTKDGEDYKGSGRSIKGVDLFSLVEKLSGYLKTFGGHKAAIGVRLNENRLEDFKEKFMELCDDSIAETLSNKNIKIDYNLSLDEIDKTFYTYLKRFEPFGNGNDKPIFMSENVLVYESPYVIGKKHIKFKVKSKNFYFDCIGFNMGDKLNLIKNKSTLNLIYKLDENVFRNEKKLQLRLLYVF